MWSILATHPTTVSHFGLVTIFTKPHRSQTIVGTPCHRQLFRRPPFRPKSILTRAPPSDLPYGGSLIGKYFPTCPHALISDPALKFMRRRVVEHNTLFAHVPLTSGASAAAESIHLLHAPRHHWKSPHFSLFLFMIRTGPSQVR